MAQAAVGGLALAMLLSLVSCASRQKWWEAPALEGASPLARQVAEIARGKGSRERGEAILRRLKSLGIACRERHFQGARREGVNIMASLPSQRGRTILLSAHYDRVDVGQGAVDNAAGCALVLDLLARFKDRPLENHRVVAVFFDQEEEEFQGSRAFVEKARREDIPWEERLPTLCLAFDIFAYGETLWLHAPRGGSRIPAAARESVRSPAFPLRETEVYPPGDHLPFVAVGVDTAAISLISGEEIDLILSVLTGNSPASPPRVLQVIHTPRDRLSEVDPEAMERAAPVVERLIRALDARPSPGPVTLMVRSLNRLPS